MWYKSLVGFFLVGDGLTSPQKITNHDNDVGLQGFVFLLLAPSINWYELLFLLCLPFSFVLDFQV